MGLLVLLATSTAAWGEPMQALVVGGGPDPEDNQVAIESNVTYVLRLLPQDVSRTTLFADGNPATKTVLVEDAAHQLPANEALLALMLQGPEAVRPALLHYRAPSLHQLDGAARLANVTTAFDHLRTAPGGSSRPLLLYFTGHGSPARNGDLDNNVFDLWGGDTLSVRQLAAYMAQLPPAQPVTLVMVQCFSGAFGNLLFEGGDPRSALADRDLVGFFATVRERPAAGCTPEVNEAEYHDFTSYFFAALTGRDRVGRSVTGADYNGDGRIGLDEAFCYSLIHDTSIDIPVCTSDVFLRRFAAVPDAEVFKTPYSQVLQWAAPAQRATLEEVSRSLRLAGEERAQSVYRRRQDARSSPSNDALAGTRRTLQSARRSARRELLAAWPGLRRPDQPGYAAARSAALQALTQQLAAGKFKALLDAADALDAMEQTAYQQELAEAGQLRFIRLFKSVVLAHQLRASGDENIKRRFEHLLAAESRSPLPGHAPQ